MRYFPKHPVPPPVADSFYDVRSKAPGPAEPLPITPEMIITKPSGWFRLARQRERGGPAEFHTHTLHFRKTCSRSSWTQATLHLTTSAARFPAPRGRFH